MNNADYQIEIHLGQNLHIQTIELSGREIVEKIEALTGDYRLDLEKLRNTHAINILYHTPSGVTSNVKLALDSLLNPTSTANFVAFLGDTLQNQNGFTCNVGQLIHIEERSLLKKEFLRFQYHLRLNQNIIGEYNKRNPSFVVTTPGTYTLQLFVRNNNNQLVATKTKTSFITVNPPSSVPSIDITVSFDISGNSYYFGVQPLSGAKVTFKFSGTSDYQEFVTDQDGFADTIVVDGEYEYIIEADGYVTKSGTLTLEEGGGNVTVPILLEEILNDLTVRVEDQDESPVVGAIVSIDGIGSETTDESGLAVFEGIPVDFYEVFVSKDGHMSGSGSMFVDNDVELLITIPLLTDIYSITFTVNDDYPLPLPLAVVKITKGGVERSLTTDVDGIAVFENLEQGEYTYLITKEDHSPLSGTVTIVDDDVALTVEMDFIVIPDVIMGHLTQAEDESEGGVISEAIILGSDYPSNRHVIDMGLGQDNFPLELNINWGTVFSLPNFDLFRFWFAVPVSLQADRYDMYSIGIFGGISVNVNFEVHNMDVDGVPYKVYVRKNLGSGVDCEFYFSANPVVTTTTTTTPELTTTPDPGELQVGDDYQGGVIFHIFQDGDPEYEDGKVTGLIAYNTEITNTKNWSDAISACDEFSSGGYTDWYLGDIFETQTMYSSDVVSFASFQTYWTSEEHNVEYAKYMQSASGDIHNSLKTELRRYKPIRGFSIIL